MPIDKFGRSQLTISGKKAKLLRGPKGDGFLLNENSDFDIQNKKLTNVNSPNAPKDVVNLEFLSDTLSKFQTEISKKFNEFKKILQLNDVFNVKQNYVSLHHSRRIVGVNSAKDGNDVIIKKDLDSKVGVIEREVRDVKTTIDTKNNIINKEILDIKTNVLDLKHQFDLYCNQTNQSLKVLTDSLQVVLQRQLSSGAPSLPTK